MKRRSVLFRDYCEQLSDSAGWSLDGVVLVVICVSGMCVFSTLITQAFFCVFSIVDVFVFLMEELLAKTR